MTTIYQLMSRRLIRFTPHNQPYSKMKKLVIAGIKKDDGKSTPPDGDTTLLGPRNALILFQYSLAFPLTMHAAAVLGEIESSIFRQDSTIRL